MEKDVLTKVINLISVYLIKGYSEGSLKLIENEIYNVCGKKINYNVEDVYNNYYALQKILAIINEKENIRKNKGVYYTPRDVVKFTVVNSIKLKYGKIKGEVINNFWDDGIDNDDFCFKQTYFDPTCGAGEFLLEIIDLKLKALKSIKDIADNKDINKIVSTVYGNDINKISVCITKLRILLLVLFELGIDYIKNISKILNENFYYYDYIADKIGIKKFDVILGNPPYVEDGKANINLKETYGNIYANVLDNASKQLKDDGVLGFIIPISYVSTPRMSKIRNLLFQSMKTQYIFSYNDRPDCLFSGVHQKLNIIIAKKTDSKCVFTSNYKYWYKEERESLFNNTSIVKNTLISDEYIPKIGTMIDKKIFEKIVSNNTSLCSLLESGKFNIYLNMRAAFWIKVFTNEHIGKEYKIFNCKSRNEQAYAMCLLNSSLFWWFWICISDCWHITNKELKAFKIPQIKDCEILIKLSNSLEKKLEKTKEHICTRQSEYAYKHKLCIDEINAIDDLIAKYYKLTKEENDYIKRFAFKYRISGGVRYESN